MRPLLEKEVGSGLGRGFSMQASPIKSWKVIFWGAGEAEQSLKLLGKGFRERGSSKEPECWGACEDSLITFVS